MMQMLKEKKNKINRKCILTQAEIFRRLSINPDNERITRQAVNNELHGEYRSERVRLRIWGG
jgi:hypothetical protein